MNQLQTQGIVLSRTNYQEADRIVTILTPDKGKLRVIVKGVRRIKSKMAGGIELFSVSELSYIPGKGEIGTLVSARLIRHYGNIVKDIDRTMFGYDLLKRMNRQTEDAADESYFRLLDTALAGLDDLGISLGLLELWVSMHMLQNNGHDVNVVTDIHGQPLQGGESYVFHFDAMAFGAHPAGQIGERHMKLLRLVSRCATPLPLRNVRDVEPLLPETVQLVRTILQTA